MNFHPILFSTEMVQAILAGRKTMTRRVMKPQPHAEDEPGLVPHILGNEDDHGKWYWDTEEGERIWKFCPYGVAGDVLWVREKHCWMDAADNNYAYAADYGKEPVAWNWKPSIHMPKAACRIFLKIKSVKVEQLHDIRETDAYKEGADLLINMHSDLKDFVKIKTSTYRIGFAKIWLHINGLESWKANPWVWVIEFERIEKPENFIQ